MKRYMQKSFFNKNIRVQLLSCQIIANHVPFGEGVRKNYGRLHAPKSGSNALEIELRCLWTFAENLRQRFWVVLIILITQTFYKQVNRKHIAFYVVYT